jgi:hypothetical protein
MREKKESGQCMGLVGDSLTRGNLNGITWKVERFIVGKNKVFMEV